MKRKPSSTMLEQSALAYLETHRGRAAIRPAPAAGRAASRVLKPLSRKFGPGAEQLKVRWAEIVGERLAAWSEPQSIEHRGSVSTLIIRARGPAAAIIQAESPRILERVRLHAGKRSPTRIRVLQGMMRPQAASPPDVMSRSSASQVSEGVENSAEARLLSALKRFDRCVKERDE